MIISSPAVPFNGFKWRWASVAPTEGLNNPPVYLGVLRALRKFEGKSPNDQNFLNELKKVEIETETTVDLVRTPERNLIRNSGQYWKALGLLEESNPVIKLTAFGRAVADGHITIGEFAATVVANLELPNLMIQQDAGNWLAHDVKFKPIQLILKIISGLNKVNITQGYITKFELVKIIEPLSFSISDVDSIVDTILAYRNGSLNIASWPNCSPEPNDHRMAAEYLLFLNHYGYLELQEAADKWHNKYLLPATCIDEIDLIKSIIVPVDYSAAAKVIIDSGVPDEVDRKKILREILERPNQSKFRNSVLRKSNSTCLITGTKLEAALEAAHIIPVSQKGSDNVDNGFCLRSDIHTLFDNGHIRIEPSGSLFYSDRAIADPVYSKLPAVITIPAYVAQKNVDWRWNYR